MMPVPYLSECRIVSRRASTSERKLGIQNICFMPEGPHRSGTHVEMKRQRSGEARNGKGQKRNLKAEINAVNSSETNDYDAESGTQLSERFGENSMVDPDSPSEEDDSLTIDCSRRKPAFQYSREVFEMKCEWAECNFETMKVDDFIRHVEDHPPQPEQRDSGTIFYCCLWESCGFDSTISNIVVRHINYHSYHTKIKAIGTRIMKSCELPNCTLDYAGRNLLPVLPDLNCEWEDCYLKFNNFQRFLYHVQCHVHVLPLRRSVKDVEKIICYWRDCKKTFRNSHKLRDHVRTHTQEKLVGCPVCGTQFSNKTKFYDHCKRQMPAERKGFKCSHCRKNFATERILRDHIRLHINKYKCPFCDMTCPFQSTLVLHIRYRHMDTKPFKCNFCEHRSKTLRDLENHQLTHCSENFWVCEQEDCDYSCRSKYILQEHYNKDHSENFDLFQYCCHICPKKYKRGGELTIHLKAQHSYRWASGHSRFKYIRGDDGNYRLQTVRYESIEVTKEMMKTKNSNILEIPQKKFKCLFESPRSLVIQECEKEEEEEESEKTGSKENNEEYNLKEISGPDGEDDESSESSSFWENLKKYLGLTGTTNFIKVMKSEKDENK